jgi:hypothetical protein
LRALTGFSALPTKLGNAICQMNNEISIIGLEILGSTLGRWRLQDEVRVAIWGRTGAKADLLIRKGGFNIPAFSSEIFKRAETAGHEERGGSCSLSKRFGRTIRNQLRS